MQHWGSWEPGKAQRAVARTVTALRKSSIIFHFVGNMITNIWEHDKEQIREWVVPTRVFSLSVLFKV